MKNTISPKSVYAAFVVFNKDGKVYRGCIKALLNGKIYLSVPGGELSFEDFKVFAPSIEQVNSLKDGQAIVIPKELEYSKTWAILDLFSKFSFNQ